MIFFMEYPDNKDTLYSVKFGNTKLRFERYDYAIGQNQVVRIIQMMDLKNGLSHFQVKRKIKRIVLDTFLNTFKLQC